MPNPRKRTLDCRRQRKRDRARMTAHRALPTTTFVARVYPPVVDTFTVGPMDGVCSFCQALRFPAEQLNCCQRGKVSLPPLPACPQGLQDLFLGDTNLSRNFHANIRQYNSSVAFASFGAAMSTPLGRGTYAFRIHGQVYHRSGSLHPVVGTSPNTITQNVVYKEVL